MKTVRLLGQVALVGFAGYVVFKAYQQCKEILDIIKLDAQKLDLGITEATEFLRQKNKDLEEKIKNKESALKEG